ncbi:cell division cycle protein 48 [Methanocella arvoryzae MRE50]|uniref:Cell division cycle protein 48 n=1 Tax=Methanocella arvoryzae (strain DSM 22066 / NBRC 105507 / MRE50) TaxID=351160 RepID=Q0W5A5_METAR|nr:cell division cycle protein 48 [Methanocella arvoryzae MRE50]
MQKEEKAKLRLKVAEADKREVGRGIARINERHIKEIGVSYGDIIQITGRRTTSAIVGSAFPSDMHLDIIRVDGIVRHNAGTTLGDYVEISRARWNEARKVVLTPVQKGIRIYASPDSLQASFLNRPVSQGDIVSTSTYNPPSQSFNSNLMFEEFFRDFFSNPSLGLGEVKLAVASTVPAGIVKITEVTEIQLMPEATEISRTEVPEVTYEDLGGIRDAIQKIREMIELPLKYPELFNRLGIDPPKGVLILGPPGTGKTLLAKAVANESDAYFTSINGPEIMSKYYGESEQHLRDVFKEAENNAPAIIFIDELDSIATKRAEVTGEVERRVVAQLLSLMDGLKSRKNVIVIGATNRPEAIDNALRRPGRFDREIELRVPDKAGRKEILQIHTRSMPLTPDVDLDELSDRTYGFVGADIAALCKESAMNVLRRVLPNIDMKEQSLPVQVLDKLRVTRQDFEEALRIVQPSALREIMIEVPNVTWGDIGGLESVKMLLREAVEWPLRYADSFRRIGVEAPKGVLLYGPPGTGKTLLAKAIANESQANFITAKGSDLLSKWYGESEKHISEVFKKARQVSPAVVFLDELDALAPVRGGASGEPRVTERIVNQLLSELDGLEELRGVVVIGATNRPDIIDPALLRPGRFDEIILVPVPDRGARREIFKVHMRRMPVAPDVKLEELVDRTDMYTGADIAYLCKKAGRLALREDLKATVVRKKHFMEALKTTEPSVTDEAMRFYQNVGGELKRKGSKEIEKSMYL